MRFILSLLVVFLIGLTQITSAQNQGLGNIDFQNINVDNLSDQQISRIYEEAQNRGLSISQIEQLAIARGMPRSEVSKLVRRLNQVRSGIDSADGREGNISGRMRYTAPDTTRARFFDSVFGADTTRDSLRFYQSIEYLKYQTKQDSIQLVRQKLKDKIYGFELFGGQPGSFQPSLNIPTPKNYQLGSGDELIIDIWGAAKRTYQLQISPDGMIMFDELGPVYVNGLTIEEATARLTERLSEIYSGLSPDDPSQKDTYLQVTLGQVRSITVTVIGEINRPGTHTLPSLATLFNALYNAGGPTVNGSFRRIQVIRGDSIATDFDLYDFLIRGDQSENIRLQDQDIIKIDPYINRVEIQGEVKRPGIYETRDDETVQDLITYTGGFTGEAYKDRVRIIGSSDREKRIRDVNQQRFDAATLENGDLVTVGKILDRFENLVEIRGAVFREGRYELTDSSTVYNLIQRADGLRGDAFTNRGLIYREMEDYTLETISFNVRELIRNPEEHDIPLQRNDLVQISSIFDLREDYFIDVEGAVQKPDRYQYAEGMTLEDIIFQAGGFKKEAAPFRIEVARRTEVQEENLTSSQIAEIFLFKADENLRISEEGADFTLQPFDKVYIRRAPNYEAQQDVKVGGEVKFPGIYSLSSKNDRISDLLERAEGMTEDAYLQGATLYRRLPEIQQQDQGTREGFYTQQVPVGSELNPDGTRANAGERQQQETEVTIAKIGINLPEILRNPGSKYDLFLQEHDSLHIPKELQTVIVKGAVFYPTSVRFDEGMNYRDYITSAGGFTNLARKNKAYVIYANGDVDRTKQFLFFKNYPNVRPGATIIVPAKDQARKLSPQERVSLLSAIVSTAALITTTIFQIRRN